MSNPRTILDSLGANALKQFSQNFLTSPHWADRLTDAALTASGYDEVWEIGPGLGALTEKLVAKAKAPVRVFEIDRKLAAYIRDTYPSVTLHEGDVLEADFKTVSQAKRITVLSNLPYHLSSPILFKLVEEKPRFLRLVLTFQKEFAERLVATPGTPDYGGLSVSAQAHFKLTSLGVLPAGAFYPPPSVSSQAVQFEPRVDTPVGMEGVVRKAFAHRRKKLASNLKNAFPGSPIPEILAQLGLKPDVRPDAVDPPTYERLTKLLLP